MAKPPAAAPVQKKPLEELESLEREITCAVCQGHYQQAKLLPCNHYYCETCIVKLAQHSRGKPFECPECRKETSLPVGGAAELQGAFFVERMKDVYSKMAKAKRKTEVVCEQCAGGKAVALCRQCSEFICRECVRSHKKMKAFSAHVVASLEDLEKTGVKGIPPKDAPLSKCPDHDQVIKMFCFDCARLICRDCTIIDHSGHNFDFLKKCAPEKRKALCDSVVSLLKVQTDIENAGEMVVTKQAGVDSQKNKVCKSIEESFEKLKSLLDQRREELVKEATTLAEEKREALHAQKEGFRVAQAEIQLFVAFIERNIENTSDQDLMSICTQLQTKMVKEEKHNRQLSLQPIVTADISCTPPTPDVIPKHLGLVYDQLTPQILLSNVNEVIMCELGSLMDVSVVAPSATREEDISANLKCVADPSSSLKGDIIKRGVGLYSINLTPRVRGRHDLTVTVRNDEISGSPFRVFVKIPPTQLEQRISKIGGFRYPWGIAINNKQQTLVAESGFGGGKRVTIMGRDGKKIQTIDCSEFQNPHGVATDADRSIYVTDVDAQCLFKFDVGGKLLKTIRNELQMPLSVKLYHNRLYVVDYASSVIKIFDTSCKILGTIQTEECPKPRDIAQGPDGLYVAGEKKISVYAPNGAFIHDLNIHPSSLELSEFNGICFDSKGDIIASDSDYGVYVFKPSGDCVQLVGSDVVSRPAGLAVDDEGFVHVCGFWSHNVVLIKLK